MFVDPLSYDVLIADNDNVGIDGQPGLGVRGTENFMAPEVVRRDAHPSTNTDLWSLSVFIFYLFVMHHPLDGRHESDYEILDWAAKEQLHGFKPVSSSTQMIVQTPPYRAYTTTLLNCGRSIHPGFVSCSCVRSPVEPPTHATAGYARPNGVSALVRLRENVLDCSCFNEVFWDKDSDAAPVCWNCGAVVPVAPRLVLRAPTVREPVLLSSSTTLSAYRLRQGEFSLADRAAVVSAHPTVPNVLGMTNRTRKTWRARTPDERETLVPPGRTVRLVDGLSIDFGAIIGVVQF